MGRWLHIDLQWSLTEQAALSQEHHYLPVTQEFSIMGSAVNTGALDQILNHGDFDNQFNEQNATGSLEAVKLIVFEERKYNEFDGLMCGTGLEKREYEGEISAILRIIMYGILLLDSGLS
jgi:hypothetical protein